MKNILYITPLLLLLLGCSYIDENTVVQDKKEATNIDSFLGLSNTSTISTHSGTSEITGNITHSYTGVTGKENEGSEVIPNEHIQVETGDERDNTLNKNIDNNTEITHTQVDETELTEIENIEIDTESILIDETDEEATIIEESTDEDIQELIDILFETSS